MPELSVGGALMSYTDEGEGDALMLVHGWIGSGALWYLMSPWLSERFRVIVPDLPGHADSAIPEDFAFDLDGFSHVLDELRQALELPRISLVGHSMGGSICMRYASRYADRVERLVLVDAPASARGMTWQVRVPLLPFLLGLIYPVWGPGICAALIKSSVRHPDNLPPDFLEGAVAQASLLSKEALVGTTRMLRAMDLDPELPAIKSPVLIIQGDNDPSVKPSESERLRDVLEHAVLHVVPDCGHCPNYEYPDLVVGLIEDFMHRGV